jgi:hypothetical protein
MVGRTPGAKCGQPKRNRYWINPHVRHACGASASKTLPAITEIVKSRLKWWAVQGLNL